MGRDAGVRDASTLDYVRSRSVGGLSSSRRAWCPQSRRTPSPPRPDRRLRACRERGASCETDREVFQRSDGIRRCLPGSHDRDACRSLHSHDRPRFSSLPSAQPPGSSLCDSRVMCKLVWQGQVANRNQSDSRRCERLGTISFARLSLGTLPANPAYSHLRSDSDSLSSLADGHSFHGFPSPRNFVQGDFTSWFRKFLKDQFALFTSEFVLYVSRSYWSPFTDN